MENNYECEDLMNDVFKEAENALSTTIPYNFKKLMTMNGYDDQKALSCINDKALDTIEEFAKEVLPNLIDSNEYEFYYGIFKNNVQKFQILSGFRKRILMVAEFYKTKFSKKNPEVLLKRSISNMKNMSTKKTCTSKNSIPSSVSGDLIVDTNIINIECERAFVETAVKKWLRNQEDTNIKELYNKDLNISIRVNENINDDTEDTYYTCNYICIIHCVVCNSRQTVRKVTDKSHAKGRWVLSNLYRHIQGHTTSHNDCKKTKITSKKVTDYFNLAESTSKYVNENNSLSEQSTEKLNIDTVIEKPDFEESSVMKQGTHNRLQVALWIKPEVEPSLNLKKSYISKWKKTYYSRKEREARRRHKSLITDKICHGLNQPLISNFYPILHEVSKLLKENESLKQVLLDNLKNNNQIGNKVSKQMENMPILLKYLLKSSISNSDRKCNANSYNETIKKFSLYLFFVGGRHLYQTLCNNMPNSIPSIPSLFRYFGKTQKISEGSFRFMELKKFLDDRGLPLYVWLSEDGTRITGRIEYDSEANKLVGFVLPLKNGCPMLNTFVVTSVKLVLDAFKTATKSKYAYCIMAQPSVPNSPSFCVSIFGTNNCFTYEDVINRWDKMIEMANNQNIHVLGFSSDGDPRLLKAMQYRCVTRTQVSTNFWFKLGSPDGYNPQSRNQQIYVQDTTHIGTKLRTRLLKPAIVLPLGNYSATITHLHCLVNDFSKDKHLLTKSDLNSVDKMNYSAAEKMCSNDVINLLKTTPDTNGTVAYLTVMQFVISAFNDHSLSIKERVYKLWFAVFFLRQWKLWIKNSNLYNCTANFISLNSYYCIELNAHALIQLINTPLLIPELFVPWLYSSQPCEQLFRTTRSLTSTFNTVVNFSIKELLNRVKRIEILNSISSDLSQSNNTKGKDCFKFPQSTKQSSIISSSLSNVNLDNFNATNLDFVINDALKDCKILLITLGIITEEDAITFNEQIFSLNFVKTLIEKNNYNHVSDADDSENETNENVDESVNDSLNQGLNDNTDFDLDDDDDDDRALDLYNLSSTKNIGEFLNLKDFQDKLNNKTCEEFENSPFIRIKLKNKSMVIKKSTLCWLLDNEKDLVSVDRLRRFIPVVSKNGIASIISKKITISHQVNVGDWAIFKLNDNNCDEIINQKNVDFNGIIIGRILAFGYVTKRSKAFNRQYILMKEDNLNEVGCYCNWYIINESGILFSFEKNKLYQSMSTYAFSIPSPSIKTIENEQLVFSLNNEEYKDLEIFLKHWINNKTEKSYKPINTDSKRQSSFIVDENDTVENTNQYVNKNYQLGDKLLDEDINNEEVQYEQVIWKLIIAGVYILVDFVGGLRKRTHYKYVCVVQTVDEEDGDIVVMGLKKRNSIGTDFCIDQKDVSTISIEMIIAILPTPKLIINKRKEVYRFPGYVAVNEK